MAGPAITPCTCTDQSKRKQPPLHRQAAESLARMTVGDRSFCIVAAPGTNRNVDDSLVSGEQARFRLCGRTFMIVEEPATKIMNGDNDDIAVRLTERELQIAMLVAKGDPVKRIAYKLGITEWTVKEYLRRIFAKLRVRSQAAMVYQCADLFRRLGQEGRLLDTASTRTSRRSLT
jgi:DNA-binding CsgD family transcriptional regulator